ncbi:hypothetical protein N6L27_07470 [Leisingera sp. SS27]|uniref:DUF2927 domain-containing protein n=1 Tax=Leisingera sp. SS27 TaxID=2979462 RepID=UPI0023308A1A|nr:hypothetical protein [Leisingera sp. SS27]MDC0657827.1 hypothetical protein [Leisingera sp. SS27]
MDLTSIKSDIDMRSGSTFWVTVFCAFLHGTQALTGESLGVEGCAVASSEKFRNDLFYMARGSERCAHLRREEKCGPSTEKWNQPLRISLIEGGHLNPHNETFEKSAKYFGDIFHEASGLSVTVGSDLGNLLIFVADLNTLTLVKRMGILEVSRYLEKFSESGIPCSGRAYKADGEVLHVNIAINSHLSPSETESCIYEELYNSSGLFSDPEGSESLFDSYPLLYGEGGSVKFPPELILMMKIYYSIDSSHFETTSSLKAAIRDLCPAN